LVEILSDLIELEDSLEAIQDFFETQGWTDGLPIVPPTVERVREMYRYLDYGPKDVIAKVAPLNGEATVERIATSAVMAGCRPEYMPVLIASVQAAADPAFNLNGVQSTTHSCAVGIIVNGPLRTQLSINSGHNCFGQGPRSNATIGRAMRLILLNIGGGTPGDGDKSTLGSPGKYSLCAAENEEVSPWSPNHVEHGFDAEDSVVTVMAAEPPHNINDHGCTTGIEMLESIAGAMREIGSNDQRYGRGNPMIVFGPEHAETVARDGYTKDDIRRYIWDNVTFEPRRLATGAIEGVPGQGGQAGQDPNEPRRIAPTPEDIYVIVAGGAGKHSAWIPTFGLMSTVMRRIEYRDGRPVRDVFSPPAR
jgi:hypothetical protein